MHATDMTELRQPYCNVIIRVNNYDQVLSAKANVFLFGCWRRAERALQEEEVTRANVKQCDTVRLDLFPASAHVIE